MLLLLEISSVQNFQRRYMITCTLVVRLRTSTLDEKTQLWGFYFRRFWARWLKKVLKFHQEIVIFWVWGTFERFGVILRWFGDNLGMILERFGGDCWMIVGWLPCFALLCLALACFALLSLALPCFALLYLALPCFALLYLALPRTCRA